MGKKITSPLQQGDFFFRTWPVMALHNFLSVVALAFGKNALTHTLTSLTPSYHVSFQYLSLLTWFIYFFISLYAREIQTKTKFQLLVLILSIRVHFVVISSRHPWTIEQKWTLSTTSTVLNDTLLENYNEKWIKQTDHVGWM